MGKQLTELESFIRDVATTRADELEYSAQLPPGRKIQKLASIIRGFKGRAKIFEEERLSKLQKKGNKG